MEQFILSHNQYYAVSKAFKARTGETFLDHYTVKTVSPAGNHYPPGNYHPAGNGSPFPDPMEGKLRCVGKIPGSDISDILEQVTGH